MGYCHFLSTEFRVFAHVNQLHLEMNITLALFNQNKLGLLRLIITVRNCVDQLS